MDDPSSEDEEAERPLDPTVVVDGTEYVIFSVDEPAADGWSDLTDAERQVVDAVVEGLSNSEIAERRDVSPRTVAKQLASIFDKLVISSRAELAVRAL